MSTPATPLFRQPAPYSSFGRASCSGLCNDTPQRGAKLRRVVDAKSQFEFLLRFAPFDHGGFQPRLSRRREFQPSRSAGIARSARQKLVALEQTDGTSERGAI